MLDSSVSPVLQDTDEIQSVEDRWIDACCATVTDIQILVILGLVSAYVSTILSVIVARDVHLATMAMLWQVPHTIANLARVQTVVTVSS
jgi:hypothetical protein